jgi:hypothetical protein
MRIARSLRSTCLLCLIGPALLGSTGAQAELGGKAASVNADRTAMKAQLRTVSIGARTVHELTRPNGGSIREFTNAQGQIYAVTWSGPGKPDLRSLLGGYFATFQADNTQRSRLMRRRPPQVSRPGLVIQTGGHMGYFWGVAYIPPLAPAGFSVTDLK